ncbi:MAG: AAA family ATPase [Clostridia bacterium]|nr:AAA family ATPase [Clostridia bacterium]
MSDVKLTNIPSMTVGKMVNKLSHAYSTVINNGLPIKTMPSVMLWGPPGVGKSQAVRQIAKEIKNATKKDVHVTDVRLLLFNPIDLRGIPTSNADKTLAVWLKPQIFQMDPSDNLVNILFLDEISAAPQSVQAAAYQITLDRIVGEHKLPDNCIVIAAGNRTTDKSVAFKMPKALANRLMHIEVEGSFKSWKEWAITSSINDKVIGFLSFRQNYLMGFDPGSDDLPSIEDIFDGKMPKMPQNTDAMYALTASMTCYARAHKDNIGRIANSIRYADKMPPDFSAVLLKDYMYIEKDFKQTLMTIPEFSKWLQTKGSLMNGSVR